MRNTKNLKRFGITAIAALLSGFAAIAAAQVGAPGSAGTAALGDPAQDLVYTPLNPPCRIFDTRNYGGGVAPPAASTRDYLVHGNAAQMAAQGGNGTGAGCPATKGEPVAVSANITAVPVGFQGHLRVYPFGAALPTVSFVNFNGVVGNNIANSGIISTCYNCASDLTVYNGSQTHHVGDVMGYFYPAVAVAPGLSANDFSNALLIGAGCTNFAGGGEVTITVPRAGKITVTAQTDLYNASFDTRIATVYIGSNAADCPLINAAEGYSPQTAYSYSGTYVRVTVPISRTITVPAAGTYTYYLNATAPNLGFAFWQAAMQANFIPQ